MKWIYAIITLSFLGLSCNQKKIIEGDLYFKMIDILNFHTYPDSTLSIIEENCKAYNPTDSTDEISACIQFLYENNLLRSPSIKIKTKDKKVKTIFLSESDYSQFKNYKYASLSEEGKKITVRLKVQHIKNNKHQIYSLLKIQSIEKVNGDTPMDK